MNSEKGGAQSQLPRLKDRPQSSSSSSSYEYESTSEYSSSTDEDSNKQSIHREVAATVDDILRRVTDADQEDVLITAIDNAAEGRDVPRHPKPRPEPTPRYPEDELEAALETMLKRGKLPELAMRPSVISHAKSQTVHAVIAEDYERAARIEKAIKTMTESLRRDEASLDCNQQTTHLKEQLAAAEEQHKNLKDEFDQRISQLKETENKRLDDLYERQEAERKSFEAEWSRPQTVMSFTKPSSSLLQVRRMQKSFAISHDFEQAKRLKAAGDEMQRRESERATKSAAASMKAAYANLLEKQEREVDCLIANGQRKLATLECERDRKFKANENLRTQLETRIKGPKQPRKQSGAALSASLDTQQVMAFKTRSQFARYKKAPEPTRLTVSLDMSKITKPTTPARTRRSQRPMRFT